MAVRTRDLLGRHLTDLRYEPTGEPVGFAIPDVTPLPVPDPRIPFDVHTTDGERVEFRAAGGSRSLSGFRPEGPALAGFVVRDFDGADRWLEEDEEVAGHPRDPFHRVDVRASSRRVQLSLDGRLLADTTHPGWSPRRCCRCGTTSRPRT
jgi:hypothetical protein